MRVQFAALDAADPGALGVELQRLSRLVDECESALGSEGKQDPKIADDAALAFATGAVRLADFTPTLAALERLERAANCVDRLENPDPELVGSVLLQRVRLSARHGRVESALAALEAALDPCRLATFHGPILFAERASLLRATGDFRGALDSLDVAEQGLRDRDAESPIPFHATTRCEIAGERGQVFLDIGRADLAAPHFEQEQRLADESGLPFTRLASILHRIHLHLAREDDDSALAQIERAKADTAWIAAVGDGAVAAFDVRAAQAVARAAIDDPKRLAEAKTRSARAVEWAQQRNVLSGEDRVLAHLTAARVAQLEGDDGRVQAYLEASRAILDESGAHPLAMLEAQWNAIAAEHARRRAVAGDDRESRAAADRLRRAVDGVLTEWDAAPRIPAGLGFFHFASRCELIVSAIRAQAALDPSGSGDERALDLVFAIDARSRLAAGVPTTLAELRESALRPDEVLCVWLPSPVSTQLFVITDDVVRRFDLAGLTRLRAAATALDEALDAGLDDASAGRALFDALIPEAAWPFIERASFVSVNGLDMLGSPAIEAARLPSGEPLGCSKAIARVPNLSWMAKRAREAPVVRSCELLELRSPQRTAAQQRENREFEELPSESVASDLLGDYLAPVSLTAAAANLDGLRAALAQRPTVLQFYTHGYLEPSDPRPARLMLAPCTTDPGGLLTCDIAESLPAAELVVLAACRSGVGPMRRGDPGAADLSGAFLLGGARAVIATGSDVRALPAAALLGELHRRVRRGVPPSAALAQARQALWIDERLDPIERRRVALRFRVDGLAHQPLVFATPHADDARSSILWLVVLVIAVAVAIWNVLSRRSARAG